MAATYEPITTQTLLSTATSVTFSSISSAYTDIVLVAAGTASTATGVYIRFNNDTGSNYSFTQLQGNGSSASSTRGTSQDKAAAGSWYTTQSNSILQFQNYANTTTYKTYLTRNNNASNLVHTSVSLWRSTSAINRIDISPGFGANTFSVGSTFTLYGIAAA